MSEMKELGYVKKVDFSSVTTVEEDGKQWLAVPPPVTIKMTTTRLDRELRKLFSVPRLPRKAKKRLTKLFGCKGSSKMKYFMLFCETTRKQKVAGYTITRT